MDDLEFFGSEERCLAAVVAQRARIHVRELTFVPCEFVRLAVLVVGFRELRGQDCQIARQFDGIEESSSRGQIQLLRIEFTHGHGHVFLDT